MAYIDDLQTRRDTVASELAAMTKLTVGGKPNASTSDGGTTIDHVKWRQSLLAELKELNQLIKDESEVLAAIANEDGAWEIVTEGDNGYA